MFLSIQKLGPMASSDENSYLAPLALDVCRLLPRWMAGKRSGVFKNGAVSNGFGIVTRIATMATSNRGLPKAPPTFFRP